MKTIAERALRINALLGIALCLMLTGCGARSDAALELTLATTTSTYDSGLLDELLPRFEKESGVRVKVVAVGTGRAIDMGRRGDADVLLTHAPDLEDTFMRDGYGERREAVMANDFVIVGPEDDPAELSSVRTAGEAFQKLQSSGVLFVSRGDNSGTHIKEQSIRRLAKVDERSDQILDCGSGMGATLRMAHEKNAYALTDRGTFLTLRNNLDLVILFEGGDALANPYSAIAVSHARHPHVNHSAVNQFLDFLVRPSTQELIDTFGIEQHGQPLFFSNAGKGR